MAAEWSPKSDDASGAGLPHAPSPSLVGLPRVRATGRGLWRALHDLNNIVLLGVGYAVYRRISADVPRRADVAHAHARDLVGIEQRLHILVEARLQYWALHHQALPIGGGVLGGDVVRHLSTVLYSGGHLPWLASALFWLYLFRAEHFARVRNVAIVSSILAIIIAAFYPLASPHFALAGQPYGVEFVTGPSIPEADLVQRVNYDPYASIPSVHVLWALLTGLCLWLGAKGWGGRLPALAFPLAMVATVVVTGNHYLLDCLASTCLLAMCLLIQGAWERLRRLPIRSTRPSYVGTDRRRAPDLRPLDYPLVLCAFAGLILCLGGSSGQLAVGLAILAAGAIALAVGRYQATHGKPLRRRHPRAEWWGGYFFVAGSTLVGAGDDAAHLAGALLWLAGLAVLLASRLSGRAVRPVEPTRTVTTAAN